MVDFALLMKLREGVEVMGEEGMESNGCKEVTGQRHTILRRRKKSMIS